MHLHRIALIAVCLALVADARGADAQVPMRASDDDSTAAAGVRVRVTTRAGDVPERRIEGTVVYTTRDVLVLQCPTLRTPFSAETAAAEPACAGSLSVAAADIARLRVRRATIASPGRTLRNGAHVGAAGALFGAATGALASLLLDVTIIQWLDDSGQPSGGVISGRRAGYAALAGAALGGTAGVVLGVSWSRGAWLPMPVR